MKINPFFLCFSSIMLVMGMTRISNGQSYTYSAPDAIIYCDGICGDINNFAAEDGTCDDGDVLCAYQLCDPYKFYPNQTTSGTDCANFLSQCLIAGGIAFPGNDCPAASDQYVGGGGSGNTTPLSANIDAFLISQEGTSSSSLVTEWKTLTSSSPIPPDLAMGDVLIYYNSGKSAWHSTFVENISEGTGLPVLGYHGGSGSSLTGGGLVCNATGSYKALFSTYQNCDWFHFGPISSQPGCVNCTPPSNAPVPPSGLVASQVSNGIKLMWPSTSFGNSSGFYKIYRRPSSTPNISYATCIVSLPTTSNIPTNPNSPYQGWFIYTDTLSYFNAVAGLNYSYSIAASNLAGEGCNGPFAQSCNWQTQGCSVCSVTEATANMPSNLNIQNVTMPLGPAIDTIHGNPIKILPKTTIKPNVILVSP